jgi:hypothetical protein
MLRRRFGVPHQQLRSDDLPLQLAQRRIDPKDLGVRPRERVVHRPEGRGEVMRRHVDRAQPERVPIRRPPDHARDVALRQRRRHCRRRLGVVLA